MGRDSTRQRGVRWGIALSAMILASAGPLLIVSWLENDPPEMRVFVTEGALSTLIVDGHARALVINSSDREATIEALGLMARPWEQGPDVLISRADDLLATGLWEALARTEPSAVVVSGVPGAAPIWAAIDEECRKRNIDLRYVAGSLSFATAHLSITVFGPELEGSDVSAVVVRYRSVNSVIALGGGAPDVEARIAIGNVDPGISTLAVLVSSRPLDLDGPTEQAIVKKRAIVRVRFEDGRVRIQGGSLLRRSQELPLETGE